MDTLSRDEIRGVSCPKCGAGAGSRCEYTGKGSMKRMAAGQNHFERMQLAQLVLIRRGDDFEVIE